MSNKARKGGQYEREICKLLSRWWSHNQRDDIFWRSSQSGGRATQRKKSGLSTYGSYGDVAAVDPIGDPLIRMFTVEIKRGRSHGNPGDLVDSKPTKVQRPFESALCQAIKSHRDAGSMSWLLISRRDGKIPLVFYDRQFMKSLFKLPLRMPPAVLYVMSINREKGEAPITLTFECATLEHFLSMVTPEQIIERCRQ